MNSITFKISVLLVALLLSACKNTNIQDSQAQQDSIDMLAENQSFSAELYKLSNDNIIQFSLDSSVIDDNYIVYLKEVGRFLANNPTVGVVVEGHADERGTPEYNIALGERRARNVQDYLMNYGANADQLDLVSFGKSRPAVLGHDEAAWRVNRRAVLNFQELPE